MAERLEEMGRSLAEDVRRKLEERLSQARKRLSEEFEKALNEYSARVRSVVARLEEALRG